MVNILVLFVMTLLFVACDDSSVDTSAENDILSSSYEGESSSSLDTLVSTVLWLVALAQA